MAPAPDPTRRFSDRVDDYERYRPGYPAAVLDVLGEETGFESDWVVADVGSGTGISTAPFLDHGNVVWAVEPNAEMRAAAERRLGARPGFHSVDGTAERTGLEDASVDLVVAAQAFHWFDVPAARRELGRILRGPAWVALIWNTRRADGSPFLWAYEALLERHGTDYQRVRHDRTGDAVAAFFPAPPVRRVLPNEQMLDHDGLRGRLTSSSYTPPKGDPRRAAMLDDLRALFEAHERGGRVVMAYDCEIFIGPLRPGT